MKNSIYIILTLFLILSSLLFAQDRTAMRLPDISGYKIIKADFHSHTVFSDGSVWPDFRAGEAWVTGLDALAITDHIEYTPHDKDLPKNLNRSYALAKGTADAVGVTLIKAAEITKEMPPGHLNALFVDDIDKLDHENWKKAVKAAHEQGAFIFWNHPGWKGQQPDGIGKWYEEHDWLLEKGMLQGIEIVNNDEYYPEVYQWCIDKNLTILGNSDIHGTVQMQYTNPPFDHRPMTWVLAKENSEAAIKEALHERRTMVYWGDKIFGAESYLKALFDGCIKLETPSIDRDLGQQVILSNWSDLSFTLELVSATAQVSAPSKLVIKPGKAVRLNLKFKKGQSFDLARLNYRVTNLIPEPGAGLPVSFVIKIQ